MTEFTITNLSSFLLKMNSTFLTEGQQAFFKTMLKDDFYFKITLNKSNEIVHIDAWKNRYCKSFKGKESFLKLLYWYYDYKGLKIPFDEED